MTPPSSQNNQFLNGPPLPNTTSPGGINQFNEIMNQKYAKEGFNVGRPSQAQGMNNGIGGQQTVTPSMPSPFSGNSNPMQNNAFSNSNSNPLMMQSNASNQQQQRNSLGQMPSTPTNSGDMMNSTVGLPSPSPGLASNGPIPPVSTPNPPSVQSLLPSAPEPTPPPPISSPMPTPISTPPNSALQTSSISNSTSVSSARPSSITSTASSGSATTTSASISTSSLTAMKMSNRSSSLSSQMAALEAAARDDNEDSPESTNNKGKEIKQDDDIKSESDSQMEGHGGKNVNNEGMNIKQEIKTESMDQDGDSNDNKSKLDIKVKDEPMSPSTSAGGEVVVKNEIKSCPEPIPNADLKKKKCSEYLKILKFRKVRCYCMKDDKILKIYF